MTARSDALKNWLREILDVSDFEVKPASADASFRSYHRLFLTQPFMDNATLIAMDAPPRQEDSEPFVRITQILLDAGINVPTIYKADLGQGFLLLKDFGNDLYLENLNSSTVDTLYSDAISTLVQMQALADVKGLPLYDATLLRREMTLFPEWLLAQHLNIDLSNEQNQAIEKLFDMLIDNALQQPKTFVHRDFHSRNLMLTRRNSPGVIDYQDAVYGPIFYDLVSLLKDCYIKWSKEEIRQWLDLYFGKLAEHNIEISREKFQRWFDLMGVQRHLKASGIFARLSHRDGKHDYLKEIPRTLSYIVDLKQDYKELVCLCSLIEESVLPHFEEQN